MNLKIRDLNFNFDDMQIQFEDVALSFRFNADMVIEFQSPSTNQQWSTLYFSVSDFNTIHKAYASYLLEKALLE